GDGVGDLDADFVGAASNRHLRSFTRERRGNGGADAGSATGYDGYFVCESHGRSPLRPEWPSARVCVTSSVLMADEPTRQAAIVRWTGVGMPSFRPRRTTAPLSASTSSRRPSARSRAIDDRHWGGNAAACWMT